MLSCTVSCQPNGGAFRHAEIMEVGDKGNWIPRKRVWPAGGRGRSASPAYHWGGGLVDGASDDSLFRITVVQLEMRERERERKC